MSFSERGLMDTMRRECWVNGSIPKEPAELAAYLGKNTDEINANLSIKVLSFFRESNDQLVCPELDSYRAGLEEKSKRMSDGGKRGGQATQNNRKLAKATLEAIVKPLSRDELNRSELSRDEKKSLGEGITVEEIAGWVADYDNSPDSSKAYLIASKGGH
jgi:hypothetical protein